MKLVKEGIYQICNRCIMDSSDPDIIFDEQGICNHCKIYDDLIQNHIPSGEKAKIELNNLVAKIKKDGEGKPYDSIIGLSGGVDSSYVAWLVKDLGLRPLAVHLDNGWNSELAVMNVENIVNKLDLDLYTIVIDWDEFRDLQLAYLRASVIDLEATSDHAIVATMYKLAHKNKIKYIINGTNVATECILPHAWYYKFKTDSFNLLDIYKKFGNKRKLKTYPLLPFHRMLFYNFFLNLKWISILNYVDYNKTAAIDLISTKLGWKNYGGKHHESIITKFYQAYILPQKTGFDKRRAHLSNLVCSAQITRNQALEEITHDVYKNHDELESEKEYVIKKLGISKEEFDNILSQPPRSHMEFKTNQGFMKWVRRINYLLLKVGIKKA